MLWAVFELVIVASSCAAATADEDRRKAEFLRQAAPGWRHLRESAERTVGTLHIEAWATQDGKRMEKWGSNTYTRFQQNGESVLLTSYGASRSRFTTIGINNRYMFNLERVSESAPYVVRGIEFGQPAKAIASLRAHVAFFGARDGPTSLLGVSLEEFVGDPDFRIKEISQTADAGKPCTRVEFEYHSPKRKHDLTNAWVTFSHTEDWALLAAEYNPREDWRASIRNEYRVNRSGRVALYRRQYLSRFSKEKIDENYQFTFDELEDRAEPESTFTLSHFGLPEPSDPASPHRAGNAHFWFIGCGLGLVVVAAGLRWAARRQQA